MSQAYDADFIKRLVEALNEVNKGLVKGLLDESFSAIKSEVQDILIEYAQAGCDYAIYKLNYNPHQFRLLDVKNKHMQFIFTLKNGDIELSEAHACIQSALRDMGLIVDGNGIALQAGFHAYKRMGGPLE